MLAAWTTKFAGAQRFNNLVIPVVEEPDEPEVIEENPDTFVDQTAENEVDTFVDQSAQNEVDTFVDQTAEKEIDTFVDETPEVIDFSIVRDNIRKRKLDLD